MPHENGSRYQVHSAERINWELRRLYRRAFVEGRRKEFLAALKLIQNRLQMNATVFGEPLYCLPSMRLQVRQGIVLPLVIDFAVFDEAPLVFIKGVQLLPA